MRRRDLLKLGGATTAGLVLLPQVTAGASPVAAPASNAASSAAVPILPQHETLLGAVERLAGLTSEQLTYVWTQNAPNLAGVPMASRLPLDELPTIEWLLDAVAVIIELLLNFLASVLPQFSAALTKDLVPLQRQLTDLDATVVGVQTSYDQVSAANAGTVPDAATLAKLAQLQLSMQSVVAQLAVIRTEVMSQVQQAFAAGTGLGDFGSQDGLARYEAMYSTMPIPPMDQVLHDDDEFAYLRVGGPNPMLLARIDALPAKFPLTDAQYRQVMGASDSLAAAFAAKRVYLLDYADLGAMAPANATYKLLTGAGYNSAPIALFVVPAGGGSLTPVAIQCGQDPAVSPMLLRPAPGDTSRYWSWQMAKTVVQTADFNYHEMYVHLGRTHLVSEAFCIATRRHLAANHPLNVLLVPHFEGNLFINELAALIIMGPDTFGDIILAAPIQALQKGAGNDRLAWDFYARMPVADFAARGVDDTTALPDYPYRDDALLVWNAIVVWVQDYVGVYYTSDRDVTADTELAAWTNELINVGKIRGFKPIMSRDQLVQVLAMIVFTASAQHAAVNYPQKQVMAYTPAYAGLDATPASAAVTGATQADWIKMLPCVFGSLAQLYFLNLLGSIYYRPLGDYRTNDFPYPPAFTDTRIVSPGGPLPRFQAALKRIEQTIQSRNQQRTRAYEYLLPTNIPSSTNI